MSEYCIGLDIGTGSIKALAVTSSGEIIADTQKFYSIKTQGEICEQVPEELWVAFIDALNSIVQQTRKQPYAVCLSAAMHSLLLVSKDHQPLTPVITWGDNRAAEIADKLRTSSLGQVIYEETGTPIHAMSPLCKIKWFAENEQALFNKTSKFISVKEFLWHRLFKVYETDYSIASASGLFDIHQLKWSVNALSYAGIDENQLSRVCNTNHKRVLTEKIDALHLAVGTNFIIGSSDGCMANVGSFATADNVAALTIGTSGAIRVVRKMPNLNFQAMIFNYRLDDEHFIIGGPTNNGGFVLRWFIESILKMKMDSETDNEKLLIDSAEVSINVEGLIFLPYLLGERAPLWNSEASGSFIGIKSHHQQKHFIRALMEGISYALYHIYISMNINVEKIHVSGGFVRSRFWIQILADIFNKPIHILNQHDASALGASYLALKTTGKVENIENFKDKSLAVIHPDKNNHDLYLKGFNRFKSLTQLLNNF